MIQYNDLLEAFGSMLATVARAEHGNLEAQAQARQLSGQLRRTLRAYKRQSLRSSH